jgi:hypothetical protein
MLAILARLMTVTATLVVIAVARKSHPTNPSAQIEITVSRNGEMETVWVKPGKITIEKHTFMVWRNSLILCGPPQRGKRECKIAGDEPEPALVNRPR